MTVVLIRRGNFDNKMYREGDVTTEAGTGAMQAKEHRRLPTATNGEEGGMDCMPREPAEETSPAHILIPDFQCWESKENKFLLFEAPQLVVLCHCIPRKLIS